MITLTTAQMFDEAIDHNHMVNWFKCEALKEQLHQWIDKSFNEEWEPIEERLNMFEKKFRCNSNEKLSTSEIGIRGTIKTLIRDIELIKGIFYLDRLDIDNSVYLRFQTRYSSLLSPFLNKELLFDLRNLLDKELPLGRTYRVDAEGHKVNICIT